MNLEEFNKFKIANPIKVTGKTGTVIGSRREYGGLGDLHTYVDIDYGTYTWCDYEIMVTQSNDGFGGGGVDSWIGTSY